MVPPHVTLVFGSRLEHADAIIALCDRASKEMADLPITFDRVELAHDPVEGCYKLFLLCDEGKDALIALHQQLHDGPHRTGLRQDIPYRPHMTVAANASAGRIEELEANELGPFPVSGLIRSLDVVRSADGKVASLRRFPFSG